jgi:HAD superfamily phosphoserine phosphatase-like hydrolase
MLINVYDFDKTLYKGDCTIDFYIFCIKKYPRILMYFPIQILSFGLFLLGHYKKVEFKEHFYKFLRSVPDIDRALQEFWENHENKIQSWYLEKKTDKDIVISASPEFLLDPMCEKLGIYKVIASRVNPRTGEYKGENCYGEEKVRRLNELYKEYTIESFYSDSLTDKPLADIAQRAFLVKGGDIMAWGESQPKALEKAKKVFLSKEFFQFLVIGAVNVFNGVFFAYLFSLRFDANTAFILGYIISLVIGYGLSSYIIFKKKLGVITFVKYCVSYIPNFIIQNLMVLFFYNLIGMPKLIVYVLTAVLAVPITFLMLKLYAFNQKK